MPEMLRFPTLFLYRAEIKDMLSKEHPWAYRLEKPFNQAFKPEDFSGGWLLDPSKENLRKPSIAIINGWGAQHTDNGWYAQSIKNKIGGIYAYDSRGQGKSITHGDLDSIQNAIDADRILGLAFKDLDNLSMKYSTKPGNKILEGHCLGSMTVAALFGGKFSLTEQLDGVILLSPISTFNLPRLAKISYFLPVWFAKWLVRYFDVPLARYMVKGDASWYTRQKALIRIRRFDPDAALRQAKQIFWKENVEKLWSYIDKPTLILVSRNDPLVKIEDSAKVYHSLRYPIWMQLEAPDHLIMEENMDFLSEFIPRFCRDPWGVYEDYKHLRPSLDK